MAYAHNGATITLSNAIRKYDDLVVDVLVIGEEDFIRDMENKYRPNLHIGWNIREGGSETVSQMMKELWADPEYRERQIANKIERTKSHPEHLEALHSAARVYARSEKGRKKTTETLEREWSDPERRKVREAANKRAGAKKTQTYDKVGNWLSTRTKHHIWERADELYEIFKANPSITRRQFSEATGYTQNEIDCMHRKYFKKGWNPNEDERWVDFYRNGGREKYGR